LKRSLGYGESAVLSFALSQVGYTAVIDDFAARRCAKIFGIITIGTGGLLVLAKRRGLISSVEEQVSRMRDNGLYLSNAIIKTLLSEAGE
jgi:predicted nucleic acid-binding protein